MIGGDGGRTVSDSSSFVRDILAVTPGWLVLLAIDPMTATAAGLPFAAGAIALRRLVWSAAPVRGRVVVGLVYPLAALFTAAAVVMETGGPALAMLLAFALIAVVEGWTRRGGRSFAGRFPLSCGALFFLLTAAIGALAMEGGLTGYPTEEYLKAVSAAPDPPRWSADARREAVALSMRVVTRRLKGTDASVASGGASTALAECAAPRGVWVTLRDESGGSARGFGKGDDVASSVRLATEAAFDSAKGSRQVSEIREKPWSGRLDESFVQIDVPGPSIAVTGRPLFLLFGDLLAGADAGLARQPDLPFFLNAAIDTEIGIDGFEIRADGLDRTAVVLPAEPVSFGWLTPRVQTAPLKVARVVSNALAREHGRTAGREGGVSLRKFRTLHFGQWKAGGPVGRFVRGNAPLKGPIDRALMVERIAAATDWLSRGVREDGRFHYEMMPPHTARTKDYNLPRHAGAVYGLFAAYRLGLEEPRMAAAGERALAAGLDALRYVTDNLGSPDPKAAPGLRCFLDKRGRAASGSTALAAIAIATLPDTAAVSDPALRAGVGALARNDTLLGMGDCLLEMIDEEGAVFASYAQAAKMDRVENEPLYFPGEVALALAMIHERLGSERFLEGSSRIALRQRRLYASSLALGFPLSGDHWIIQALSRLAGMTGDDEHARLAVLMGRGYLREQYPPQAHLFEDYAGAYRRVLDIPRTTRAASRGEALTAAMRAARSIGEDPAPFERALVDGARHLIEQQFTEENSYFVPSSWNALGGIRMGLVDNHLRIDNNQHAIVGLMGALEAMSKRR